MPGARGSFLYRSVMTYPRRTTCVIVDNTCMPRLHESLLGCAGELLRKSGDFGCTLCDFHHAALVNGLNVMDCAFINVLLSSPTGILSTPGSRPERKGGTSF